MDLMEPLVCPRPKKTRVRFSMDKNTALISEVKKFPALYDTSDRDYHILSERNKAWLQVARNFNESVDQCQIRWRSLRKRYARERRKIHEVLQGERKPWPLFPKMAFLAAALAKPKPLNQRKLKTEKTESKEQIPFDGPDDDMLILDANDEIVRTCKSEELSEEDEYIYETLDDPDSAFEIMDKSMIPASKPKAIRSGGAVNNLFGSRVRSGRIRKLTPKMQNSIIAKKLKQAQEILQSSEKGIPKKTQLRKGNAGPRTIQKNHFPITLQRPLTDTKYEENVKNVPGGIVSSCNSSNQMASVPQSFVRVEPLNVANLQESQKTSTPPLSSPPNDTESNHNSSEDNRSFKVVKVTGRNPIIFSPKDLPDIQQFLRTESASNGENKEHNSPQPSIKVKSVENLNQNLQPGLDRNTTRESNNNLDIIHSVGLMRKGPSKPTIRKSNGGGRQHSWNKAAAVKNIQRRDFRPNHHIVEKRQPDSQTSDYQIEEAWNDIKQELPDDCLNSLEPPDVPRDIDVSFNQRQQVEPLIQNSMLHKVNEAKLELIAFQRRLLEEQHRRSLEYMKKEHDMKMTLLKAEIDLKRKQLNIML